MVAMALQGNSAAILATADEYEISLESIAVSQSSHDQNHQLPKILA